MVQLFVDGGGFMIPILLIFIIGLAFVIERLYHLIKGLSSDETFAEEIANAVKSSGIDSANHNVKMLRGLLQIYAWQHWIVHIWVLKRRNMR